MAILADLYRSMPATWGTQSKPSLMPNVGCLTLLMESSTPGIQMAFGVKAQTLGYVLLARHAITGGPSPRDGKGAEP
jgi:hypothetical protein